MTVLSPSLPDTQIDGQHQVLDSIPVGLCLLAEDSTILAWNRTLADWTGVPATQALQQRLTDLFPSLQDDKYLRRLQAVFTTGAPTTFSAALHHHFLPVPARGHEGLMVQDAFIRLTCRNPPQALVTIQDVTVAVRQVERLRTDRQRLQDTAHSLEVTNSLLELSIAKAAAANRQLSDEIRERTRAEEELRRQAAELMDAQARAADLAAQRERYVEELTVAQRQALAGTQAKSAFLANMSHEIRTPLTAILGYVDMLQDGALPADDRQHATRAIYRNGEHLLAVINDVLDLSKIEAGKMTIDRTLTDPKELIETVFEMMTGRAQQQGISLLMELAETLPARVLVDPIRLQQILVNLVGNGIKFTKAGSVKVIADWSSGAENEGILCVRVVDTGIGIREDQLQQLFQPFTQADSRTTREFGGTGLGLTISRKFAELMGGNLTVASQYGAGSTFTLTLKCESDVPRESRTVPELASDTGGALAGIHVLIADDVPDNQRLLAYNLRKAGATFETAGDGQVVLEMVAAAQANRAFDLILMDIQMPILDGYATTRQLRDLGYRLPIIALTAGAMSGDHEKCLAAGCDDYVTKPIHRQHFVTTIAQAVTRSRLRTVNQTEQA